MSSWNHMLSWVQHNSFKTSDAKNLENQFISPSVKISFTLDVDKSILTWARSCSAFLKFSATF